jgi:SAM-dependent methyltransferase
MTFSSKRESASSATDDVLDLIFGRWRSQILAAGTELGVFDHLEAGRSKPVDLIAAELRVDPVLLYRLLRAQAAIGLLVEHEGRSFSLTEGGDLLRSRHPRSLNPMARLEEGPQHYALWKHLPAMIRDGKQNAFLREFGEMAFDYARLNSDYGARFKQAMSSYSAVQSALVLEALHGYDFSRIREFCDVAGGYGHLLSALCQAYPHLSGTVLDLPEVVRDTPELWVHKLGLEGRCRYVGGDMFEEVPVADAYSLKMILHDWSDDECLKILDNIRRSVRGGGRLFVIEHIVPPHNEAHFSKLFDIHMMCWGSGQERTVRQYGKLLEAAGWKIEEVYYPSNRLIGVIEGAPL